MYERIYMHCKGPVQEPPGLVDQLPTSLVSPLEITKFSCLPLPRPKEVKVNNRHQNQRPEEVPSKTRSIYSSFQNGPSNRDTHRWLSIRGAVHEDHVCRAMKGEEGRGHAHGIQDDQCPEIPQVSHPAPPGGFRLRVHVCGGQGVTSPKSWPPGQQGHDPARERPAVPIAEVQGRGLQCSRGR